MWVLDDPSINAASFGRGIFVLWTGLVDLTDEQIDAVLAHEFAHDQLQHSKKRAELRDVTDFVGQAIGVLGGRDDGRLKRSSVGPAILLCRNTIEGKSWRLMPGR